MIDKISITEFCKRLSFSDKRVELIGGFHFWMENTKKVTSATEAQFKAFYAEFCALPA